MAEFDDLLDNAKVEKRQERNQRPDQLSALVVLSIVGVVVWSGIIWSDYDSLTGRLANFTSTEANSRTYVMAASLLVNLLGTLGCLIGVIMMWRLKRIGFYAYLVGQMFTVFSAFFSIRLELGLINTLTSTFILVPAGIIMLAFILLYGQNLRYMR